MENNRFIKLFSFFGIFLAFPLFIFAYSEKTTHPALTDEIVDLFNSEIGSYYRGEKQFPAQSYPVML